MLGQKVNVTPCISLKHLDVNKICKLRCKKTLNDLFFVAAVIALILWLQ